MRSVFIRHPKHDDVGRVVDAGAIVCNNCGYPVDLDDSWDTCCDCCLTEYNCLGQELAPREQWDENYVSNEI